MSPVSRMILSIGRVPYLIWMTLTIQGGASDKSSHMILQNAAINPVVVDDMISVICTTGMVSDRLIPPSSHLRTHLVHLPIHQPPTPDNNNISH